MADGDMIFFLDVDNTLINNDKVKDDIDAQMRELLGTAWTDHFWEIYEKVRHEMDGVDIPTSLKRIQPQMKDPQKYYRLYRLWMDFPYKDYIFPGVFETIAYLKTFALPIIISDGDASFQLRKIVKAGLSRAVEGYVFVYLHKDHHFEDITTCFEARHYVMVEDKPSLLSAAKQFFLHDVTTLLVQQGKYASQSSTPEPDLVLPSIADLVNLKPEEFWSDKHITIDNS